MIVRGKIPKDKNTQELIILGALFVMLLLAMLFINQIYTSNPPQDAIDCKIDYANHITNVAVLDCKNEIYKIKFEQVDLYFTKHSRIKVQFDKGTPKEIWLSKEGRWIPINVTKIIDVK